MRRGDSINVIMVKMFNVSLLFPKASEKEKDIFVRTSFLYLKTSLEMKVSK